MNNSTTENHRQRRRFAPLIWVSGGLAAVLLVLGVSGTLSSWTSAVINNDSNTVKAADSVILQETGPGSAVCNSTDNNDGSNEFTCSTINKYGGVDTPLNVGDSQTVSVNLKNTGTASGALTLAPGTCTKTLGSPTSTQSICDVATVTVECTTPSALDTTGTPVALSAFASKPVATLAAGASTDCTFTVALPTDASPQIAGQVATQPLVWTLAVA